MNVRLSWWISGMCNCLRLSLASAASFNNSSSWHLQGSPHRLPETNGVNFSSTRTRWRIYSYRERGRFPCRNMRNGLFMMLLSSWWKIPAQGQFNWKHFRRNISWEFENYYRIFLFMSCIYDSLLFYLFIHF